MEMFSRKLFHTLDFLGCNDDMVEFRRESWKCSTILFDIHTNKRSFHSIMAGSKGEGITSLYESDIDMIHLVNGKYTLCVNTIDQLPSQLPPYVFLVDMTNVPPGYTRLKLYRPSSRIVEDLLFGECLFESESGEVYLSSTLWTTMHKEYSKLARKTQKNHDVTGPSVQHSEGCIDIDHVLAFSIHCPQLLQTLASRPRHHEWPSHDVIRTACSFLPQVVPVGAKGSDRQFQEWRFCFIESELTLTHSLNGTQTKLYILLKMIAKDILKPVTGEMSSYIMKNVTYWLSELLPLHEFREENLVSLVLVSLAFLRAAITQGQNLPYYMIPSRNLLSERLDDRTSRELSDVLGRLLQEGPTLFLRVKKLRIHLEFGGRPPNDVGIKYGKMRDRVEKNALAMQVFFMLEGCVGRLDESIQTNLLDSNRSLVVPYMHLFYPGRCSRFNAEEFTQAIIAILS